MAGWRDGVELQVHLLCERFILMTRIKFAEELRRAAT